jgi:acetylornithine/LysW-gamma-L-lysine aminotransferase
MGAFAYTARVREALSHGAHGSTFGGSPLACAAGLAAIDTYRGEGLIEHSATLGARMLADLQAGLSGLPIVRDVRGLGLMLAVELRTKVAPILKSLMLDHHVIALPAGPTILRLLPPLVITEEEASLGVTAIVAALTAASSMPARRSAPAPS